LNIILLRNYISKMACLKYIGVNDNQVHVAKEIGEYF
jgi:hypothetical protein